MPRLMTWNCRGIAAAAKFAEILEYRTHRAIDAIFVQEGSDLYDNDPGNAAANIRVLSCDEKNGAAIATSLAFDPVSRTGRALQAAFNRTDLAGITGDGQNKKYTLIYPTVGAVLAPVTPDYANTPNVSAWMTEPASDWVGRQPDNDHMPIGAIGGVVGGKRLRQDRSPFHISPKRRGGGFEILGAQSDMEQTVREKLKEPTMKRVNLLGRRRPRKVDMVIAGAHFDVYFYHASLGGAGTLEGLDLDAYAGCKGHASGGDVALIANILFAQYLGIVLGAGGAFPANTLLVGDLNIDAVAAAVIYGTANIASSLDGWCHIIAPMGVPMVQVHAADFQQHGGDYRCIRPQSPNLVSDHAPVLVDI